MRALLAEFAPELGDVEANLGRIVLTVDAVRPVLAVFPELFLSGYRVGDRIGPLSLSEGDGPCERLGALARRSRSTVVLGAPYRSPRRPGETMNAVLMFAPDGARWVQGKRFLPTFGPFEEGRFYSASDESVPARGPLGSLGLEICYDLFFPEVSRELALHGASLLVAVSAAPVTSRRLFDRILPARAIENALPVVYVNRVGAEDGLVFGGGSAALDARGEALPAEPAEGAGAQAEERALLVEIDLSEAGRWRPFRPVLRDWSARPAGPGRPEGRSEPSGPDELAPPASRRAGGL